MTSLPPEEKQPRYPTVEYRVTMRDGSERIERVIGLSEVAAYHPDAVQVTRLDWAGFY